MKIKFIETIYRNNAIAASWVINNYTYKAWWREIKLLPEHKKKGTILDYEDVLDLDKGTCERKVWL